MPYTPVSFGSFAGTSRGELFDPVRDADPRLGRRARRGVRGCRPVEARALFSARRRRPCTPRWRASASRCASGCGMFDASTLGKIEVVGPDAAEFLNRLYVNSWTNLGVGRCRYGILLREDGFVYDDGVVARTRADRFHVTTTTGGAPRVLA
jgi:sarcosine oxidase, subunit alpha